MNYDVNSYTIYLSIMKNVTMILIVMCLFCRLITLTFIVPPRKLFLQTRELSGVAQGLMDVLVKNNFIDNHIVFHVFSNGGCLVYTQLIHLLNMPDSPFRDRLHVRGVIFDSAPGKKRILQATKAFMLTVQANVVIRFILGFFLLVYLMIMQVVSKLVPGRGFLLYKNVMEDPTSCPQLFLYSKADKIILSEDVEEMITARKERGFDVKSICWDDSEHVSHFRSHPEIYTKTCQEFVASCLDSQL